MELGINGYTRANAIRNELQIIAVLKHEFRRELRRLFAGF